MLTSQDGLNIAKKLGAEIKQRRKHTRVLVVIDNVVIGSYGLSRGSQEQNHDYIVKQIGRISPRQARELSLCPLSKEEYVKILQEKGQL